MIKPDPEQLRQIPFFSGLPGPALQVVLDSASLVRVQPGEFMFYQDDPTEHVYVLTAGRIKLTQIAPDGQQVIMRVATPWMMIAATGIVSGSVYPVSAEAAEESQLLRWTQARMLDLIGHYPGLALNAVRVLADHVRELQDRYRELATERVERRLARTILRLANQAGKKTHEGVLLDLPLTRQDLAEMSGTTLFTVSRILTRWEGQGLIQAGRERIVIRFPHGLVGIAEDQTTND
jgi:CRP-like cAMP-binding protein